MTMLGDPAVLTVRVGALAQVAELLGQLTQELAQLSKNGQSTAIDSAHDDLAETTELGVRAHSRYVATGVALEDYAVHLFRAHDRAREVTARIDGIEGELADVTHAQTRGELTEARLTANLELLEIRQELDRHAEQAIARIEPALVDLDDGAFAALKTFGSSVLGWSAGADDWIQRVFTTAWSSVKRIVMTINNTVTSANVLLVASLGVGIVHPALGLLALTTIVGIAGFMVQSILSDVTRSTPAVHRRRVSPADAVEPEWVGDALADTIEVDRLSSIAPPDWISDSIAGGQTIIKVTRVVGVDGQVRWRVVLPSTQEWLTTWPGEDYGLTNDLDTNIALLVAPLFQTQYERAVLDALDEAGVQRDDPVMLIGFSQGGILAGHLAAYNTSYRWDAIVVAGAPIDGMPIPADTSIVSVQHRGDPVHHIDTLTSAIGAPKNMFNWMTLAVEARDAESLTSRHNAEQYAFSLQQNGERVQDRFPELDSYFVSDEGAYGSATTYFGWAE